jgi:hypothetical protein
MMDDKGGEKKKPKSTPGSWRPLGCTMVTITAEQDIQLHHPGVLGLDSAEKSLPGKWR